MKLQVNLSGSWRDVISFDDAHEIAVKEHAAALAHIAGAKVSWRISDSQNVATARLSAPSFSWKSVS